MTQTAPDGGTPGEPGGPGAPQASEAPEARELRETVDYIGVTRLQARYADAVSCRAWAEFAEIFAADAVVVVDTGVGEPLRLAGPDGVSGFISGAIERFEFFQFVPLNTRVETSVGGDPDAAEGRLYICELRQDRESGRWTNAFGVYHDQYRRTPGPAGTPRWVFVHRRYQSLARTTGRAEVFDFPHHLAPGALGTIAP
ncbi:nuclear transport factor 2 family protein [Yinghuangia soli]|uniref:Nuclear transport factor 2 family protein n=1 Tax=Yinghuangia soli TaxID=2908204 RepID=A0AA41PZA6_9ACTN|nr:nuclear transport factor 2 family protein [Yinghuangia soli]MCF2527574.1 nuclear transport factor 2 family protein [Yinghuangia soli]